jgi:hypothetical protein
MERGYPLQGDEAGIGNQSRQLPTTSEGDDPLSLAMEYQCRNSKSGQQVRHINFVC